VVVDVPRLFELLDVPARIEVAVVGIRAGLVRRRLGDRLAGLAHQLVVEPRASLELRDHLVAVATHHHLGDVAVLVEDAEA
jgi:hypothetical protein